jgi:hypothetical protein
MNYGRILLTAAGALTLATTLGVEAAPRPPMVRFGTAGGAADGVQLAAEAAAQGEIAVTVNPGGPNPAGSGKAAATPAKPDAADPKVAARMDSCKLSWKAADQNGDGVLDAKEVAYYNNTVRLPTQPVLPESGRLTQQGFIAACSTVTAHE